MTVVPRAIFRKAREMSVSVLMTIQFNLGRLAVFLLSLISLTVIRLSNYRIREIAAVRAACAREFRNHKGPWLICANHLTMIDSIILTYGIMPFHRFMLDFSLLPWNLPERSNFHRSKIMAVLCYLSKCIPVHRGGDREELRRNLEKCEWVMRHGQSLMIFPEGGRSRTGRIDQEGFSYGVGRFVSEFENCHVMCIYLRGDRQVSYSTFPRRGERFTMIVETYEPERGNSGGLRAQRAYAEQIINRLAKMEESYFAFDRKRCGGFDGSRELGEEPGYPLHQKGVCGRGNPADQRII